MARITLDDIKQTYRCAKDIHEKKLIAINKLAKDIRMNPNSAKYYVEAFLNMVEGRCYEERISVDATEYFLKMISVDFGQQYIRLALSSVEQHIKHRESFEDRKMQSIRKVHRKFSKKLQET